MALHDPEDLRDEAEAKLARKHADLMMFGLKAGSKLNTLRMIEELDVVLCDTQALGELIQNTAAGKNAFLELLNKLALQIGEEQAEKDMAKVDQQRAASADEQRAEIAIWHREFA